MFAREREQEFTPGPMIYPTDGRPPFQAGGNWGTNTMKERMDLRMAMRYGWRVVYAEGQAQEGQEGQQQGQLVHASHNQQVQHSSNDRQPTMTEIQNQLQGFYLQAPVMPQQTVEMGENRLVKRTVTEREVTVTKKVQSSSSRKSSSTGTGKKEEKKDEKKGGKK